MREISNTLWIIVTSVMKAISLSEIMVWFFISILINNSFGHSNALRITLPVGIWLSIKVIHITFLFFELVISYFDNATCRVLRSNWTSVINSTNNSVLSVISAFSGIVLLSSRIEWTAILNSSKFSGFWLLRRRNNPLNHRFIVILISCCVILRVFDIWNLNWEITFDWLLPPSSLNRILNNLALERVYSILLS